MVPIFRLAKYTHFDMAEKPPRPYTKKNLAKKVIFFF